LKGYGWSEDTDYIYLLMELLRGNLSEFLYGKSKRTFTSEEKFKLVLQISDALRYLKEQHIIHRDIKCLNILLGDNDEIRVCDFGISKKKQMNNTNSITLKGYGTLRWMAPETLTSKHYSFASDVFGLGVVLFEIVEESEPYPGFEEMATYEFVTSLLDVI
jgi:serine/threonine protein kinase